MLAQTLIAASAGIVLAMGTGHLCLTLFTNAFQPADAGLEERLKSAPLNFSPRLAAGPAMTGFNATHSMSAMMFGLFYGYLALEHAGFLFQSPYLLGLGVCIFAAYVLIGLRYWFYLPLIGISLAGLCYLGGLAALAGYGA